MYTKIELGFLHGVMYTINKPSGLFFSLSGSSSTTVFFFLAFNSLAKKDDDEGMDSGVVDTNELEGNRAVDGVSFLVTLGPTRNDSTPRIEMRRAHNNGRTVRRVCFRENIVKNFLAGFVPSLVSFRFGRKQRSVSYSARTKGPY